MNFTGIMRFTIESAQAKFFRMHHYLVLDALLPQSLLTDLLPRVDKSLSQRLGILPIQLQELAPEDLFFAGRDLSRHDSKLQQLSHHKSLYSTVYELTEKKPVRYAYDQLFRVGTNLKKSSSIPSLFSSELTLSQITGLQGPIVGVMLSLAADPEASTLPIPSFYPEAGATPAPLPLFSLQAGQGIFFSDQLPLNFGSLFTHPNQCYLMVVFAGDLALVVSKENDPHPFAFKQLGYSPGDRLSDLIHPILRR